MGILLGERKRMNAHVILATGLAASALAWPLYQSEIPPGFGEWPLNIAVMAFVIIVINIFVKAIKDLQDRQNDTLKGFQETMISLGQTISAVDVSVKFIEDNLPRRRATRRKATKPVSRRKSRKGG